MVESLIRTLGHQLPTDEVPDQDTYRRAIGRRLADALARRSLKPPDLASAIGVAEGTVRGWLRGRFTPNAENLGEIRRVLRCSLDWLVGEPDAEIEDVSYLLNTRTEALVLGSQVRDEDVIQLALRVGIIADAAAEPCSSLFEFAERLTNVRKHVETLQDEHPPEIGR